MKKMMFLSAGVAASLSVLAACGGDGDAVTTNEDGSVVVTASVVPSIDSAGLYLADSQGFFEDEGIDVEFTDAGSGPASVAAVVGGSADVGLAANVALVLARNNNVPILAAAPAAGTGDDPATSKDQVVVAESSGISSFADLTGKTVAVVAVKNSPELFVRDLIDKNGGDSSSTEFVELPFPEMGSALSSGRVDAVAVNEPFLSGVLANGGQAIGSYIDEVLGQDAAYTYWFTSEQFANGSGGTIAGFTRAMAKAGQYADENPEEVRRVVIEELGIEPAVAEKINLPKFGNPADVDMFATVAELMVQYDFIDSAPDLDGILVEE